MDDVDRVRSQLCVYCAPTANKCNVMIPIISQMNIKLRSSCRSRSRRQKVRQKIYMSPWLSIIAIMKETRESIFIQVLELHPNLDVAKDEIRLRADDRYTAAVSRLLRDH